MADQAPPDWRHKILHATMIVGDTAFSGGDVLPASYERPQGFQIQLNLDDVTTAERIFTKLADGGWVTVPLQQTFWAQRFGAVVDRFGIPWGINCGEPQVA
jgi:PhnB protein